MRDKLLRLLTATLSLAIAAMMVACGRQGETAPGHASSPVAGGGSGVAARPSPTPPETVRAAFTGDVIPSRCVYARQLAESDFTYAFHRIAPFLRAADVTVGSLDASISSAGRPMGCTPTFNLLAPPQSVDGLV